MDTDRCVCLFKKGRNDPNKPIEWLFNGKIQAHNDVITSICFGEGLGDNSERKLHLFSVSRDRTVVEYDIEASSLEELRIKRRFSVENEARPTACIWYPKVELKTTQEDLGEGKQNLLLTMNDDYKAKIWNVNSSSSRRTCLGPTYGGEIVKMKLLNLENNSDKFIIYSTKEKVIGLIKMPFDGNPNKTMGLIAHPKKIVDLAVSADGKYLFTCGGDDLAINMWSIDVTPIDQAIALGGEGIEPFVNLIEGGREGKAF
jgi:WD40 repeat protein